MPQVESLSDPRSYLPNTFTSVDAREVDFVTQFGQDWKTLRDIMGISRPIKKAPGTRLVAYKASVTLQSGSVDPGEVIPYSASTVEKVTESDLSVEKFAKAVTIEDVTAYGAENAIARTDEAFRNELINLVLTRYYTFLKTGTLTATETTFQMGLALAKARVLNKFAGMRKKVTDVIGFVNVIDAYEYLGAAGVTVQTAFGISYIKDFLGYSTLFLCADEDIPRNKIIAVPVNNIVQYYVDPADSDYAKLGLEYRTDGETNLVGFHAKGNYNTAVGEVYAILGMALWAEYLDGISVVTVEASGSLGSVSSSTAAYSAGATGDTTVTISTTAVPGGTFYFKSQATNAPAAPSYLDEFDTTGWTKVVSGDHVASTNNHKYRIVELNGAGQAIATGDGTVTAKT